MPQKYSAISRTKGYSSSNGKDMLVKTILILVLIISTLIGFYLVLFKKKDNLNDQNTTETNVVEDTNTTTTTIENSTDNETDTTTDNEVANSTSFDFSSENQSLEATDDSSLELSKVETKAGDGYITITFTFNEESKIPATTAKIISGNAIELVFSKITSDNSSIKPAGFMEVSDSVVSNVYRRTSGQPDTSVYQLGLKASTEYFLHSDGNKVLIEVQEVTVSDTGSSDTFAFSQDLQSFSGNASGNVITLAGISHASQGDFYRITLRLGTVGTGSIPAATAEIVDYEGGKAVKVELKNMNSDIFAKDNISQDYNDKAVKGLRGSYSNNTSTYYVLLTSQRDYQLSYLTSPAQVMIDVKR